MMTEKEMGLFKYIASFAWGKAAGHVDDVFDEDVIASALKKGFIRLTKPGNRYVAVGKGLDYLESLLDYQKKDKLE